MQITIKAGSVSELRYAIYHRVNNDSRFTCQIDDRNGHIKLRNIRLKESKLYCGNHPNECENNFGGSPRRGKYLEGADWVSVNDLINDICDNLNIEANIYTSVCWIRKGTRRRTHYGSSLQGFNWQWNKDEDGSCYEDYRGEMAPDSTYPHGTPGEYTRDYYTTQVSP